jgi:hypothetical protein
MAMVCAVDPPDGTGGGHGRAVRTKGFRPTEWWGRRRVYPIARSGMSFELVFFPRGAANVREREGDR